MNKIFVMYLLCFLSINYTFSQEIDKRLLKKYSESELQNLQKNDPKEYQFLLNAINKGVFIAEIPKQKEKDIVFDGTLKIDPTQIHTFISLRKEITDKYQYFRIKGTTKMLVILPRIALDDRVLKEKTKK
jgi:hypothetical protein